MRDYVVVYPYLTVDSISRCVVEQNYLSHVESNPNGIVVPVSVRKEEWIPHTVFVDEWLPAHIKNIYKPYNILLYPDYLFFAYLNSPHKISAKRYVLVDWDTFSHEISLPSFLGESWYGDVGGNELCSCCSNTAPFWCGDWCGCSDPMLVFKDFSVVSFSEAAALSLAKLDPECICPGFSSSHGSVRVPTTACKLGHTVMGSSRSAARLGEDAYYNFPDTPNVYQSVRTPLLGGPYVFDQRRD